MISAQDVRAVAMSLPRTEEHLIRDRVKFRVGKIVYVAISSDETTMGFGFPREERAAMIAAEHGRFFLERLSDQRFSAIRHQLRRPAVLDLHHHLRQRCAVQPHLIDRRDTELRHTRRLHHFTAYFTPYG